VIQNDIEVLNRHDSLSHLFDGFFDQLRNMLPCFIDVIDLINVEQTSVRPEFFPYLVVERNLDFFSHEGKGIREYIEVGGR
jgi:hypothetical protein